MVKAIVQDRYGPPEVLALREIAQPAIGPGEVLVRIRAAGVHRGDWHLMTGLPYLLRLGFGLRAPRVRVRGTELAGTVAAVGAGVTRFREGEAVFGIGDGSFAEYTRAREDRLAPMPATLTFEEAAAVPTSACTALQGLRDVGKLRPGQTVLIVGASGGVGSFAVQIARVFGAEVTGVCSASKMDLVRSLGADRVIDYASQDFTAAGRRYDLILDIGGDRPLSHLRRALTPRGRLVLVGGEGGGRLFGVVGRLLRALVLSPLVSQTLRPLASTERVEDLLILKGLIEEGAVRPIIDRRYALSDAAAAMRYLAAGGVRGKLVIAV